MKIFGFHNCIVLVFFVIFVFFCSLSLINLQSKKTGVDEDIVDITEIMYPSVTVCKKYTFENKITGNVIKDARLSIEEKKKMAIENIWDISKVFYFVSHPNMMNMTFPCLTKISGGDPAKPCSAPFHFSGRM